MDLYVHWWDLFVKRNSNKTNNIGVNTGAAQNISEIIISACPHLPKFLMQIVYQMNLYTHMHINLNTLVTYDWITHYSDDSMCNCEIHIKTWQSPHFDNAIIADKVYRTGNPSFGTEGLKTDFQGFSCVIWNECIFLLIMTHECAAQCVIITQKLHEIPYHTVNHWNELFNPFLPCECASLY